MKRWQDRGEVLDSDDEDDSLAAESQSPARKKARLEENTKDGDKGAGARVPNHSDGVDENGEEEAGWMQTRVAMTSGYGRRTKHAARIEALDDGPDFRPSSGTGVEASAEIDDRSQTREDNIEDISAAIAEDIEEQLPATQSTNSEDLPDMSQLLKRPFVDLRPTPKASSPPSPAPSSPLSERAVSPSPPPMEFRLPSLHIASPQNEPSDDVHQSAGHDRLPPTRRRNLRARNEKQLHPYLVELAQYQKQLRERGMRPLRILDTQRHDEETQNESFDLEQSGELTNHVELSSPSRPSTSSDENSPPSRTGAFAANGDRATSPGDDEDLPDLADLIRRGGSRNTVNASKRRKLTHPQRHAVPSTNLGLLRPNAEPRDEFFIPPSPPPTSSDSGRLPTSTYTAPKFRLPPGATPASIPTPQISSELRPNLRDEDRVSPTVVPGRVRREVIPVESGSEPSEAEMEDEDEDEDEDERQLLKERKRIKGVLPASWLKIDFHAQQRRVLPSPGRGRSSRSPSPPLTVPQKGVAQRVRKSRPSVGGDVINVSDDGSGEDRLSSSPGPSRMRQASLSFQREATSATILDEFVDDERMELDWVDPMVGGSAYRQTSKSKRKRQPRITEAFGRPQQKKDDFAEERRGLRAARGGGSFGHTGRAKRKAQTKPAKQTKYHRLSILDAPSQQTTPGRRVPAFVRLAMRTARHRPEHARHSPSGKQIRLATSEDTEDASAMLRAWREGTVMPRKIYSPRGPDSNARGGNSRPTTRAPLVELSDNVQQHLPDPLRKEQQPLRVRRRKPVGRHVNKRQTQLHPTVLPTSDSETAPRTPAAGETALPSRKTHRRTHRSTLQHSHRDAQIERLESDFDRQHRAAAFERKMQLLTETLARGAPRQRNSNIDIARFLRDVPLHASNLEPTQRRQDEEKGEKVPSTSDVLPHRPRKHRPRRVDAETREYRQPNEPLPDAIYIDGGNDLPLLDAEPGQTTLQGLGPFGTRYATDFDILPLTLGTYCHGSSFIGSGDFAASLNLASRNLDISTGRICIHLDGGDILEWGPWTEDISTGLTRISDTISGMLVGSDRETCSEENASLPLSTIDYLLRSTTRYFTRCLSFLDAIDRRGCVQRTHTFVEGLLELCTELSSDQGELAMRCLQYALVLAKVTATLSDHPLVSLALRHKSSGTLSRAANQLAGHLFPTRFTDLRTFLDDNRHASKREGGIRDSDVAVSGVILLHHVLHQGATASHVSFWDAIYQTLQSSETMPNNSMQLDTIWFNLFTILPFLEIDAGGIARVGSRMHGMPQDWSLAKRLMARVFELYDATSQLRGSTINDYVRATITRCYRLVAWWGWWKCEPILGTIFDFFARGNLARLRKEESRGSPKFLDGLEGQPSLEIQPEDRSFHLFLKILVAGLRGMHKHDVYSDKKIGSIAWRFIPNHGRTYRKDAEVRQEDLDTLRNHHDLLCTLYYATPPTYRLGVEKVQNLVDHSVAHREACRLNVRAWANLAAFQTYSTESTETLDGFTRWYTDILSTTTTQYRLARTEAEQDAAQAMARGALFVPRTMIEDTIARNQRQIAATMVDALAALKRALRSASNIGGALRLLNGSVFWQVFEMFEPSHRRLYEVVDEALEVVKAALQLDSKFSTATDDVATSEDSQDYGDFTALQELASTAVPEQSSDHQLVDVFHGHLARLVSNVFGADASVEDTVLAKIIEVWTSVAHAMVRKGKRSLESYINGYTSEAWNQLRDTQQRRKYTPYFLSRMLETSHVDIMESGIFNFWLTSLVAREAVLKFQHSLTTALLNHRSHEALLRNLPFARERGADFDITLRQLRERRVGLISSVLSNMREGIDQATYDSADTKLRLHRTYTELLKSLMQAMKKNYQDLQASHSGEVADAHVQGAYVEFVQDVVSSMQQYTADICKVDSFFTDSSAFPLPASDPTYVVGRLRSYVSKLAEMRRRKELAAFIQTVSERAAVDNQQPYLVSQLVSAMSGTLEHGSGAAPSLRCVLLTSVFPAYIETALSSACSWIVARPILQACGQIMEHLLYMVVWEDATSIEGAANTIASILCSMTRPLQLALAYPGQMRLPHAQAILAEIFTATQRVLTCARALHNSMREHSVLVALLDQLIACATEIESHLSDPEAFDTLVAPNRAPDVVCPWPDTLDFARTQIRRTFDSSWFAQDGQYYVRRSTGSVEVSINLGDEEDEKRVLLKAIRAFRSSYETVWSGRSRKRSIAGGVDLIV